MTGARCAGASLWLALSLVACGATTHRTPDEQPSEEVPPAGTAGAAGGTESPPTACELPPRSLTRLSIDELVTSARAVLGEAAADQLIHSVGDRPRTFPAHLLEGALVNESLFRESDSMAQAAGRYVREHFELTQCAEDDFGCVRQYVADLAEGAFRRPLTDAERVALLVPVDKAEELGVGAATGAEYGVYAVFESPHFMYRTALGEPGKELEAGEQALTDHELASAVSFFLTGGPPDAELLKAAQAGALSADEGLESQVDRLLGIPLVRRHLDEMVGLWLGFDTVEGVVIDPSLQPDTNQGWRGSVRAELDALVSTGLWDGSIGELLTTRRSRLDENLAGIYGVPFPPAGSTPDAEGFVDTLLPETRAGLLTRAGWSLLSARPDRPSVVARGLRVMSLLCEPAPPFPELEPEVQSPRPLEGLTEVQLAEYRMTTRPCSECHTVIDPAGLAQEDLDLLGRFRTLDAEGRPIDASATLPAFAGGVAVTGARQLSEALPEASLARCFSQTFLMHASASIAPNECERDVMAEERRRAGDQSFSRILKQIALSRSFRLRRP